MSKKKLNTNGTLLNLLLLGGAAVILKKRTGSLRGVGATANIEIPLRTDAKNGFRWKKNANYRLRYNPRESAYEVFEDATVWGGGAGRIKMFVIYSDNKNIGVEIVRYLQQKYGKGYGSISYENTTYGF